MLRDHAQTTVIMHASPPGPARRVRGARLPAPSPATSPTPRQQISRRRRATCPTNCSWSRTNSPVPRAAAAAGQAQRAGQRAPHGRFVAGLRGVTYEELERTWRRTRRGCSDGERRAAPGLRRMRRYGVRPNREARPELPDRRQPASVIGRAAASTRPTCCSGRRRAGRPVGVPRRTGRPSARGRGRPEPARAAGGGAPGRS